MIEFKNISKHYQLKGQTIRALDQINLQIPDGSIFGIIGMSHSKANNIEAGITHCTIIIVF